MKAETRIFGIIDIEDDKVITMEKGMIGFPDYKHFALIFDKEREEGARTIMWLQCMDDGDIAFPVITPDANTHTTKLTAVMSPKRNTDKAHQRFKTPFPDFLNKS